MYVPFLEMTVTWLFLPPPIDGRHTVPAVGVQVQPCEYWSLVRMFNPTTLLLEIAPASPHTLPLGRGMIVMTGIGSTEGTQVMYWYRPSAVFWDTSTRPSSLISMAMFFEPEDKFSTRGMAFLLLQKALFATFTDEFG
ncbi:hypothetical protein A7317_28220 [Pseudomonas fluorescens]|nr:hypothetical protein A7317_28220 [Pseudomonas fluorescens]AOE76529.1 hypothetical protein A7319_27990 [Pseudomonas fluorescens]